MCEDASLLQVTVCEVTGCVCGRNDALLNVLRETGAPHGWRFSRCKEYSPHALLGSIHRANHRQIVRHNLRELGRMVGDSAGKSFEVCQVGSKVGGDLHVMLVSMRESQLEGPKETGGPQDGGSHEAEFTKQPLPFLDTNSPFVVEVLEDG